MRAAVSKAILFLCSASIAAAHGMRPVPVDGDGLIPGRNILVSVSADTLKVREDSLASPLVKARSVLFDKRVPGVGYDEFRMRGMVFSEFTVLGRSGDSLFVTAASKRSREGTVFYPLYIPMGGLMRIYDAKDAPENIRLDAELKQPYSPVRPVLGPALAGASLGLLLGTGIGMQFGQTKDEPFDQSFRRASLFGGVGAILGTALVLQVFDL